MTKATSLWAKIIQECQYKVVLCCGLNLHIGGWSVIMVQIYHPMHTRFSREGGLALQSEVVHSMHVREWSGIVV